MTAQGRVVVAGSINADIVMRTARLPRPGETVSAESIGWHPGGKGANQAAAAAIAGCPTLFIGCVGSDDHGTRLRQALERFAVEAHLRAVDGPSGQAYITVDAAAENTIVVVAGANGKVSPADVEGLALTEADVAVTVLEVPAQAALAFLRAARPARRILNPTPVQHCTAELLAEADIVVVNEHEHEVIQPTSGDVVVTLGREGARVGGQRLPGVPVDELVDTTGAGDCFVGTLAARLAMGDALLTAAGAANVAAARSVTRAGAMESYT